MFIKHSCWFSNALSLHSNTIDLMGLTKMDCHPLPVHSSYIFYFFPFSLFILSFYFQFEAANTTRSTIYPWRSYWFYNIHLKYGREIYHASWSEYEQRCSRERLQFITWLWLCIDEPHLLFPRIYVRDVIVYLYL